MLNGMHCGRDFNIKHTSPRTKCLGFFWCLTHKEFTDINISISNTLNLILSHHDVDYVLVNDVVQVRAIQCLAELKQVSRIIGRHCYFFCYCARVKHRDQYRFKTLFHQVSEGSEGVGVHGGYVRHDIIPYI